MPINVSINSGKDFEPVSEGIHAGVLVDIVDLGPITTQYGTKEKLQFVWLTDEADEEGQTKRLFKRYTKSLHEKASLRAAFIKIAGRDLTAEELASPALDIEPLLLGRQNQFVVEHSEDQKTGKVYANITSIMKPKAGVKIAVPADFQRDKDKPADKRKGKYGDVKAAGGGRAAAAAVLKPGRPADDPDFDPFGN